MKKTVFVLALLVAFCAQFHAQEVPFLFKLEYHAPKTPTLIQVVLFDANGVADTLVNANPRVIEPSVRRAESYRSQYRKSQVERWLPVQGNCRLFFRIASDTISLSFPVDTSSVDFGIEASLLIESDDKEFSVAYPSVNVYRTGTSYGRLFYVGFDKPTYEKAPSNQQRPFFNFQSYTDSTLRSGNSWSFCLYFDDEEALTGKKHFPLQYPYYVSEGISSLGPHQSMRFSLSPGIFSPGRHRAYIVFSPNPNNRFSRLYDFYGCRAISYGPSRESIWLDAKVQTWYVSPCDFHLTTLDIKP